MRQVLHEPVGSSNCYSSFLRLWKAEEWPLPTGPSYRCPVLLVALNTIATQATLSLLLYAAFADRSFYTDVALWLASFSYFGTIVWARYLERRFL